MNKLPRIFWVCFLLIQMFGWTVSAQTIYNGIPWFDNNGNIVNAHAACIVEDGGWYYLFGEYKSDTVNVFTGFSCYSSDDLVNWQFERIVLPQQKDGLLGPNRVGERVKVMKSLPQANIP
jgi:beta-xylosidase